MRASFSSSYHTVFAKETHCHIPREAKDTTLRDEAAGTVPLLDFSFGAGERRTICCMKLDESTDAGEALPLFVF